MYPYEHRIMKSMPIPSFNNNAAFLKITKKALSQPPSAI